MTVETETTETITDFTTELIAGGPSLLDYADFTVRVFIALALLLIASRL